MHLSTSLQSLGAACCARSGHHRGQGVWVAPHMRIGRGRERLCIASALLVLHLEPPCKPVALLRRALSAAPAAAARLPPQQQVLGVQDIRDLRASMRLSPGLCCTECLITGLGYGTGTAAALQQLRQSVTSARRTPWTTAWRACTPARSRGWLRAAASEAQPPSHWPPLPWVASASSAPPANAIGGVPKPLIGHGLLRHPAPPTYAQRHPAPPPYAHRPLVHQ